MKNKILILTYYWPPSGGPGVQRWLKFVKYLAKMGWDITIYTPENPEFPVLDPSLQQDVPSGIKVIRRKIWEPYSLYKKFSGKKKDEGLGAGFLSEKKKPSRLEGISKWVRGNWFIPDARKFWIKPSVKFLNSYLAEHPVDLIISTGPPHSLHLIAKGIHDQLALPWMADFRDPWTEIDFVDELKLTNKSKRKHAQMEKSVLEQSDCILVVSETMKTMFSKSVNADKIQVVPNGYDEDDFAGIEREKQLKEGFVIAHVGTLTPARNAPSLWKALAALCEAHPDFGENLRLTMVGKVDISARDELQKLGLWKHVVLIDYLEHNQLMKYLTGSHVLLLLANQTANAKMILTGKVFEYLKAERPILAIAPHDGDLAKLIHDTQSGVVCDFEDTESMKKELLQMWEAHQNHSLELPSRNIGEYSREALTNKIAKTLDGLLSNT